MRLILTALAFCAATALSAQDGAAQEVADFQSRELAATSRAALATGDRLTALTSALQGLPAAPTEGDLDRFAPAYDAFLRAAVSRSLRLDVPVMSVFTFDKTGRRLASVGLFPSPDGDQSRHGLTLWDANTGAKQAELLPIEAMTSGAWGVQAPAFSPDGRHLVQMAPTEGVAVVYDTATGQEVARLDGHQPGTLPNSGGLAFSRDGSLLLTLGASPTVAHLWDTATWTRLARQDFGQFTLLAPIAGGRDGTMQFLSMDVAKGDPPPLELWSITAAGATLTHSFPAEPSGYAPLWGRVATDDGDSVFALPNGNFDLLVFARSNGAEIARIPASTMGQATGMVAPSGDGVLLLSDLEDLPRKVGFDGADAPLVPADKLVGLHNVFALSGEHLGTSADFVGYRGADLPRGPDLVALVLGALPAETQAQIAAGRIAPD
ncbi:MAG: WD40 repeat domain-containing protein [Pseudomonadota bacterium]